jgi:hypothetical protein
MLKQESLDKRQFSTPNHQHQAASCYNSCTTAAAGCLTTPALLDAFQPGCWHASPATLLFA